MPVAHDTNTPRRHDTSVNRARLLAKLVREILNTPEARAFTSVADVVDALKYRCARLRIGWTNDAINDALRLVASNVPLPGQRVRDAQRRRIGARQKALEERVDDPPLTRAEASALLQRLGVRL